MLWETGLLHLPSGRTIYSPKANKICRTLVNPLLDFKGLTCRYGADTHLLGALLNTSYRSDKTRYQQIS
jgi:hypothetical protein